MLLFDWKKVFDTAEGNIPACNTIMEMLINQQIPRNKFDRIYKYSNKNFTGSSFLLHGDFLLYHSYKYTQKELCIYYALASLRSYADYIAYNKTTLDRTTLSCASRRNQRQQATHSTTGRNNVHL